MMKNYMPIYLQIKEDLIKEIKEGRFAPGDKIYSENELKKMYGVSSNTVIKTFAEMVKDGYLYRVQGKGTFVAKQKVNKMLNTTFSFTDELKRRGFVPTNQLVSVEETVDEDAAGYLQVNESELLLKIVRIRFADGEPIAVETSFLPTTVLSKEEALQLNQVQSLYALLKQTKGIVPDSAKEFYNIRYCDQTISRMMEQEEGEPNFFARRITYNSEMIPFEYTESYIRWDRYTLENNLKRAEDDR